MLPKNTTTHYPSPRLSTSGNNPARAASLRGPRSASAGRHASPRRSIAAGVLPDGSRSLIPAGWTDLAAVPVAEPAAATENGRPHSLARLVDFLHARTILDALLSRVPGPRPNPATTEESCRATDSGASRAARAAGNAGRALDPEARAKAIEILARMIAQTLRRPPTTKRGGR
jgi:hypothetical protein